jgi:protocatechuate 3,4-dioxygenase beta subunit
MAGPCTRVFYFGWITLFATVLDAQQVQPPPKPESCSVEGQLVNAATGEPVTKANITLWGTGTARDQRYVTTTTAAGRFAVPDMEPGKYRMSASKRGYSVTAYGARAGGSSGTTLSLDPGQHLSDVVWRIAPQAVITGRVLDVDGEPSPNIQVSLLQYRFVRGKRQLAFSDRAATNDLGEYRLFELSPGRYYLSAMANTTMRPGEYDGGQAYAPTYYPGTSDAAGAKAIELQAGTLLRGTDITLTKTRTARVRGRVVDPDSKQRVQGVGVSLHRRGDESQFIFWGNYGFNIDAQGNFEIRGVVPGAYYIEAVRQGDGKALRAHQPIDVRESDIENIVLELQPGAELKGQLRIEGRAARDMTDGQISLQPDDSGYRGGVGAPVKTDGSFTLTDVQSARYSLEFYGGSDVYYLKSARLGDQDVLESGLDLTRGVSGTLEVVLSTNGGQVEGVVLNANEQPEAAATVALVPDDPRRSQTRLYKDATTDQYGRFTIVGIAPGGYKLFAWEDVEDGAYEDPDYLKAFEALGEPRVIRERSRESAQLKLISDEGKKMPPQ